MKRQHWECSWPNFVRNFHYDLSGIFLISDTAQDPIFLASKIPRFGPMIVVRWFNVSTGSTFDQDQLISRFDPSHFCYGITTSKYSKLNPHPTPASRLGPPRPPPIHRGRVTPLELYKLLPHDLVASMLDMSQRKRDRRLQGIIMDVNRNTADRHNGITTNS